MKTDMRPTDNNLLPFGLKLPAVRGFVGSTPGNLSIKKIDCNIAMSVLIHTSQAQKPRDG